MAQVSTTSVGKFYYHFPAIAAIVTSHAEGKDNAMTVAWHAPVSFKPPLYGVAIAPHRFTLQLILEGKEFGVNFLPFESAELMASVGGSGGRKTDKFERFHISKVEPVKTKVPLLEDAYACYECKLVNHRPYGDHEWVVGEIVAVHFSPDAFTAEGVLDITRLNPAFYLGAELYITTSQNTRYLDRKVYGQD